MTYGSELKTWREKHQLSLRQAGARIGVSGPSWQRLEREERKIKPERVIDVEAITGISRFKLRPDVFGEEPKDEAAQ